MVRRLPRDVYVLQAGLVVNAFGNGAAGPFLLLYLHDVRGISLAVAGLVPAVNATVALGTALLAGSLADNRGSRPTMVIGLCCSATAFVFYPFVREAWQAFPLAVLGGIGGGTWLTGQSSLLAAITPAELRHVAFAQQRVVANVGLGLGGFAGGVLVAVAEPETFTRLFFGNAVTFLVYAAVLLLWVHEPIRRLTMPDAPRVSYRDVARDGAFVRFAALHFVFVLSTISLLNAIFPVFARNEAGLSEDAIGVMFLLNSLLIVTFQLPVARAAEGRSRMRGFALIGALFALCWSLVLAGGAHPARNRLRRGRDRGHEPGGVHLRLDPGPARVRSGSAGGARPLHGGDGLLVAGRVHCRPCARGGDPRRRAVCPLAAHDRSLACGRRLRAAARAQAARGRAADYSFRWSSYRPSKSGSERRSRSSSPLTSDRPRISTSSPGASGAS